MKEIFTLNTRRLYDSKLVVKNQRTNQYGTNTLRRLAPEIWNALPEEIKNVNNINIFKTLIKTWSGPVCMCNRCRAF